jgi:isopenicillin-N epimerase
MCAPVGSGFLRVERAFHESLDPLVASWGLVAEEETGPAGTSPHDAYAGRSLLARRLQWQGTRDISAFLAVPAAIDFLSLHDGPEVAARCASLAEDCAARCAALLGREPVSPQGSGLRMALIPLPPCEGTVLKRLLFERFQIEAPVTGHSEAAFLRVSFHLYNGEADIQALLGALEALFPGGKACAEIGAA